MPTVAPNSTIVFPKGHESSYLRPVRDSDNPQRVWQRDNRDKAASDNHNDAIQALTRKVEGMRRRILGGSSTPSSVGGVNLQTTNYTATDGDYGKLISFSSSSALTLTLPSAPPSSIWFISVECVGAGGLIIDRNSLQIDGASANIALVQNQGVFIFTDGINYYTCRGIGSSSTQLFAIGTLSNADYVDAYPISVSYVAGVLNIAFGSSVKVAKHNRMRPSVTSELIDGVTTSYSGYTADNTRFASQTVSGVTTTEYQVAFPRYTDMTTLGFSGYIASPPTGSTALTFLDSLCVFKGVPLNSGVKDGSGNPIVWEEIQPRVWARRFIQ